MDLEKSGQGVRSFAKIRRSKFEKFYNRSFISNHGLLDDCTSDGSYVGTDENTEPIPIAELWAFSESKAESISKFKPNSEFVTRSESDLFCST